MQAPDVIVMSHAEFNDKLFSTVESAVKKAFENFSSKKDDEMEFVDKIKAANFLNCSVTTIDNMRRSGRLKSYRLGGAKKVLFKKSELSLIVAI